MKYECFIADKSTSNYSYKLQATGYEYRYESSIIDYFSTSSGKGYGWQNDYRVRSHLVSIPPNTGDYGVRAGNRLSSLGLAFELPCPLVVVVVAVVFAVSAIEVAIATQALHWRLAR